MTAMLWRREAAQTAPEACHPASRLRFTSRESVVVVWLLVGSAPALAQSVSATAADVVTGGGAPASANDAVPERNAASGFLRDVGSDYKHFVSKDTAIWLGAGGVAALAVHQADQEIADWVSTNSPSMPGGSIYGSQIYQIPAAIAWWIIGSAAGSESQATVGRDLLRAQLSVVSWTYAVKFIADRTRPNGDPRGFPSGHASTSFATAAVLQEHFGWKVGLPAFVAAAYTGVSRIADNQHWASDIVFGAAVGMASGRTVTIHVRDSRVTLSPVPLPGGIGVTIGATR
jgi:membrane-associated phospholipid phosphatase